jgi:hypothetical protein
MVQNDESKSKANPHYIDTPSTDAKGATPKFFLAYDKPLFSKSIMCMSPALFHSYALVVMKVTSI